MSAEKFEGVEAEIMRLGHQAVTQPLPATPAADGELDELERLAKNAGGWHWSKKVRPARVLALVKRVRDAEAERDALRAAAREAEDAHDRADNALASIHAALWPGHRTDWVFGEATGMAAAIVAGVGKAVAERDALWRAVAEWIPITDRVPDNDRDVLTLIDDGTDYEGNPRPPVCEVGSYRAGHMGKGVDGVERKYEWNSLSVTHWRELPAPPLAPPAGEAPGERGDTTGGGMSA